jgi:signal transduction histidine kinase
LGKTDFDFFPEEEARFFQAKDRETLAGHDVVDIPEELIQTAAGPRWLHTMKVPLRGADGQPLFLLGISEDITDKKAVQDALRVAQEATLAAYRELESFSYSVSHDLRAPLRSIDGFSEAVLEDCGDKLDPQGRDHLERVRAAAQKMARLIDDLLALSRLTRAELRSAPLDLSAMALSILRALRERSPGRNTDLRVASGLCAHGDPHLVEVALENLLANAWKFTGRRPLARIEVGSTEREGAPCFFVKDNGAGFDMAYAHKLFAPFQRLHGQTEFDGTGVGLATVKRILQRHGGRVWAEAEVDQGATFFFTLPPPAASSGEPT